jgi:integrase
MSEGSNEKQTNKGGRKLTGHVVKTADGRWQALIRLADGTRKRIPPFPAGTSEAMAREKAAALQERAKRENIVSTTKQQALAQNPNACTDWVTAWVEERERRGLTSARDSKAHWKTHLLTVLGSNHPREWTRHDFRRLSVILDEKVQSASVAWKTAQNIWTTAIKMASDAAESKLDTIKCRDDNPADGVRGPDRGEKTGKQFLFPSEFTQYIECTKVPLKWRRIVAIAVYTYARAGELRALTWDDVDLERGILSITKAIDRTTGGLKSTKTKTPRLVPIEPALLPLLQAMHDECDGKGQLIDLPSERDMARGLRRWLRNAGIERRSLLNNSPGVRQIRFHDMRATGVTWMAIRGDDPLKIQQRAGHTEFATTQDYIRDAEPLRGGFGEPFPQLPPLDQVNGSGSDLSANSSGNMAGRTGLEPAASGVTGRRYNQLNYRPSEQGAAF